MVCLWGKKTTRLAFEQMTNGLPQRSMLAIHQHSKDMRCITIATDKRND